MSELHNTNNCVLVSTQNMFIKWGNDMSELFTVTNGVRQGDIISPKLFNMYMISLVLSLTNVMLVVVLISPG